MDSRKHDCKDASVFVDRDDFDVTSPDSASNYTKTKQKFFLKSSTTVIFHFF